MRLPLALTFFRIVMSPIFVALYLFYPAWGISPLWVPYLLLLIVMLCELTDIFDGFLARKRNQVTSTGKVLDPMADSLFRLSVFFAFTTGPVKIPLMIILLFFWRDLLVNALRALCALQGIALAARSSGKIKAVIQAATILMVLILMIPYTHGVLTEADFQKICLASTALAAVYTLYSGFEYFWAHRKSLKKIFYQ